MKMLLKKLYTTDSLPLIRPSNLHGKTGLTREVVTQEGTIR